MRPARRFACRAGRRTLFSRRISRRSQIVVRQRFAGHALVDGERIAGWIELTRFPVPDDGDHAETNTEAGLVRAADLIGQLGDPLYRAS